MLFVLNLHGVYWELPSRYGGCLKGWAAVESLSARVDRAGFWGCALRLLGA